MPPPPTRRLRLALDTSAPEGELTIDDLSAASGLPVRMLRLYRSKGLLDPPVMHGRVGYYCAHHVLQLELVRRLVDRGFPLRLVADLLATDEGRVSVFLILEWLLPEDDFVKRLRITVDSLELDALRGSSPAAFARLRELGLLRESGGSLHVSAIAVSMASGLLGRRVSGDDLMAATVLASEAGLRLVEAAESLCPSPDDAGRRDATAYVGTVVTHVVRSELARRHTVAPGEPDQPLRPAEPGRRPSGVG